MQTRICTYCNGTGTETIYVNVHDADAPEREEHYPCPACLASGSEFILSEDEELALKAYIQEVFYTSGGHIND